MLSYTEHPISFEIVAAAGNIVVQIVCSEENPERLNSLLVAYFPTSIVRNTDSKEFGFSTANDIAIADFGMDEEFMRPIAISESLTIDPLISIIAAMESLQILCSELLMMGK